jgi:rhodanese-related sulfurtransferase
VLAGRPLVYGAIQGFDGQASVFNWQGGPTYRCLFPEPPEPGTVPNCAEAGVLGVLPGLIGTVQATEAIKLLTGLGEPLSGRLLLWDALTMTTRTVRLAADPRSRDLRELPPAGYGETCQVPTPAADETEVAALLTAFVRGQRLQLIDVREEWERALGAIEPSLHAPLGALERGDVDLTGLDPAAPTIVYCASGVRSLRALITLRVRHGFLAATSLRGGYKAWTASG